MPTILPIKELRDTTKISETCHNTDEPIFITKNGYGDMVLMSMETYNSIILQNDIDTSITKFEEEATNGTEFIDAKKALSMLPHAVRAAANAAIKSVVKIFFFILNPPLYILFKGHHADAPIL